MQAQHVYFISDSDHYLGHVVSKEEIAVDPENIKTIMEWPTPGNMDGEKLFMGLASYYRHFIRNFYNIGYSITYLHRKGKKFEWTKEFVANFD